MEQEDKFLAELVARHKRLISEYKAGRVIHFKNLDSRFCLAYSEDRHEGQPIPNSRTFHGLVPRLPAVVAGLDIREYSRRKPEQQMFLTMNFQACLAQAVDMLRDFGLLPPEQPRIILHTGDGAHVVFTFPGSDKHLDLGKQERGILERYVKGMSGEGWAERLAEAQAVASEQLRARRAMVSNQVNLVAGYALSFILAFNSLLQRDNVCQRFVDDSFDESTNTGSVGTFPVECRYALSYDEVLPVYDTNHSLNCVGSAMVTCTRILSTDHGNHFLVADELLRDVERHGGLCYLCGRQWKQRFHATRLDDAIIKSGRFRFADVFGFYRDDLLLRALRRFHQEPSTFHIGSHNLASIDAVFAPSPST